MDGILKNTFKSKAVCCALIFLTIFCVFGVYHTLHSNELNDYKKNDKINYGDWLIYPVFTSSLNPWISQACFEFVFRKKVTDDLIPWKAVCFGTCLNEGMLMHILLII